MIRMKWRFPGWLYGSAKANVGLRVRWGTEKTPFLCRALHPVVVLRLRRY